jgi:hypothetical protein
MTVLLIAAAALIVGALAFRPVHTLWVIHRSTSGRTKVVVAQRPYSPGAVEIDVRVLTPHRSVKIVEVEVARPFSEVVQSGPPDGFRYTPHLQDGEPLDPDSLAARWDAQWVRYTGELAVAAGAPGRVRVPVDPDATGAGEVRLRYVDEIGVGGAFIGLEVARVTLGTGKSIGTDAVEQAAAGDESRDG